jgi:hypothetical protein
VVSKIGLSFKLGLSLQSQVSGFKQVSGLPKFVVFAVALFQIFRSLKFAFLFSWQVSFSAVSDFQNWLRGFSQSFGRQSFLSGKVSFLGNRRFRQCQPVEIGFKFSAQVLVKLAQAFSPGSFGWQQSRFAQSFFSQRFGKSGFGVFNFRSFVSAKSALPKIKLCVKVSQVGSGFQAACLVFIASAQQSVHLTLGILRQSQAVFYALSFFWLDGFAVPAPARVTQTVGQFFA